MQAVVRDGDHSVVGMAQILHPLTLQHSEWHLEGRQHRVRSHRYLVHWNSQSHSSHCLRRASPKCSPCPESRTDSTGTAAQPRTRSQQQLLKDHLCARHTWQRGGARGQRDNCCSERGNQLWHQRHGEGNDRRTAQREEDSALRSS